MQLNVKRSINIDLFVVMWSLVKVEADKTEQEARDESNSFSVI